MIELFPNEFWLEAPNRYRRIELNTCGSPWSLTWKNNLAEMQKQVIALQEAEFPNLVALGYHYNQDMKPYLVFKNE